MREKIEKSNVEDILELSQIQKGMLFHYLMDTGNNIYNTLLSFYLEGNVDVALLKEAFLRVQGKNEALRSVFRWKEVKNPVQLILKNCPVVFTFYDLSAGSVEDGEKIALEEWATRLDLEQLPVRISVMKLDAGRFRLNLTHHHILYDGWSSAVLLKELFASYHDLVAGSDPIFPKCTYREMQQQQVDDGDSRRAFDYWKDYLAGFVPISFFPTGSEEEAGLVRSKISFPAGPLEVFAGKNNVSRAAVVYSAYGILLQKYFNNDDLAIGITLSSRNASVKGMEEVIGNFVNTVPLRFKREDSRSLLEIVNRVNRDLIQGNAYNRIPMQKIKELMGIRVQQSVFDTVVGVKNYPLDGDVFRGRKGIRVSLASYAENTGVPLTLSVFLGQEVGIEFTYSRDIVPPSMVAELQHYFSRIFRQILDHPASMAGSLGLLSASEEEALLLLTGSVKREWPVRSIADQFRAQVEKTPDNIAVVFEDRQLSYREFDHRSSRIAAVLIDAGVVPGQVVGLMADPSPEMMIGLMGIIKAGAAFLPLNPELPQNRLDMMRTDAGCQLVLSHSGIKNDIARVNIDEAEGRSIPTTLPQTDGSSLLYVIYTSGTSGQPKGVMIQHGNMVNYIGWLIDFLGLRSSDSWALTFAFSFDGAYTALFGSLLSGATLHLLSKNNYLSPSIFLEYAERNGITHLKVTPSLYAAYADHPDLIKLRSLKMLMFGGEPIRTGQVQRTMELLSDTRLVNHYGPSETTVGSIAGFIEKKELADFKKSPYAGRPIDNTTCFILGKDGQLLPAGIKGELYIGGSGVAAGYLNRPGLTQRQFLTDPFSGEGRLYKTGDWATFLSNGKIRIFGRMDNQVKIRGIRIELREIENNLLRYPDIVSVVVLARGDEGNKYLVGYFTAAGTLATELLENWLLAELPEYMVPHLWVQVDKLPLTLNGKLDIGALPDPVRKTEEIVLPANVLEYSLSTMFSAILNTRTENIGVTQSFFELGGHSLNATALTNRIYKELNVDIPLSEVFRHSSIRELAQVIARHQSSVYTGLAAAAAREGYELSYAQKRLFVLHQLDPFSIAYNMPYVVELEGEVDADRLKNSLKQLVRRHESLRTSFDLADGRPLQRIAAEAELEWFRVTGTGEPETVFNDFIRPFDLSRAPLMRAGLIESKGKLFLLIDIHHLITDGQSRGILINDLLALYSNRPLPPVRYQYKDYTEWQKSQTFQDKLDAQKKFWTDQFMEECPVMDLPADHVRPAINTHQGDRYRFEWSIGRSRSVRELAQGRASVFMTLFSFFYILMAKLSNLEDITVGTPVAGRQHPDLEGIVGMFVNILPLRVFPKGHQSFLDFLAEVRAVVVAGMDNQDYPYEALVEELKIGGDTSRNALFSTVFVLDNFDGLELKLPGIQLHRYPIDRSISKFDLTLLAKEENDRLSFQIEYSTSLFKRSSIERFAGYFNRIVDAVLQRSSIRLSEIDLLTGEDRRQLQARLDRSGVGFPRDKTIIDLFRAQALRGPATIAVTCGERQLTYADLDRRSDRVAGYLRRSGTGRNGVVGAYMDRSIETVVGILGILKAGAAYLPLDTEYAAERIDYMVEDSGAVVLSIEEAEKEEGDEVTPSGVAPSDLAYIIYTSGTTGQPKGVMIDHRNVVRLLFNDESPFDFSSGDVWTMFHSPSFDFSVWEIFGPLLSGGRLVVIPRVVARDSRAFLAVLHREGVTILNQTPRAFYNLIQEDAESGGRLEKLRLVIFGGEALAPAKLKSWKEKYDHVKLINMYGITETTVHVTYKELKQQDIDDNISNIGRPLATLSAYVLDAYGHMLPPGVAGELYIGGEGVARGYINKEQLTRERFIDHPWKPGQKLYRSGDHVRLLESGDLQYCGRIDRQIKLRGFRIELAEIERTLSGHRAIRDTVVIALEKNEQVSLAAYYVSDGPRDPAELRVFLSKKLPEHMIPSYFVHLRELPLTSNGKLNKRALPEPEIRGKEARPQNAIQKELLRIWSGMLAVDQEKIGIHANFFEIGGNSLLIVQLASRIEKTFGVKTGVAALFAHPTISMLAAYLDEQDKEQTSDGTDCGDDADTMSNTLDILHQQ